jgi:hypothetical protein
VRKEFSDGVARTIYPAMKRAGLGRQGKRLWYDRRPDTSWVLVEIQMSDHTTRTRLEFTVNTAVWPPGTWAVKQRSHPVYAAEATPATAGAPIFARPDQVRPDLWPHKDFAQVELGGDIERAVADLLVFLLAALQWGRAHAGLEAGLAYMTRPFDMQTHRRTPNYRQAVEMLREVAPDHPQLPALVEKAGPNL